MVEIEITGPAGSGKTTAGALITKALREFGFGVDFNEEEEGWMLLNDRELLDARQKAFAGRSGVKVEVR